MKSSQNPMNAKLKKFGKSKQYCENTFGLSSVRLHATSQNSHNGSSSTIIFSKSSKKKNQNTVDTQNLKEQLKCKDRQLQQCIEAIVNNQKVYAKELQDLDLQYEEEIAKLHSKLYQAIQNNKELEEQLNIINILGLQPSLANSIQPSEESSMLLNDCDHNI